MNVIIFTIIPMPIDQIWSKLETSKLLEYVASPILTFKPLQPKVLPVIWQEESYQVNLISFGFIPLGKQSIVIKKDINKTWLLDSGHGDLCQKWEHFITLETLDPHNTKYTDKVIIEAGILTPFVWLFAQFFYRYRQYRWRKIAKNNNS